MNFGDRLKELRESKGLTQEQMAEVISVTRPTIAGYETKGKQPDYDKLKKLADYFNVSIDYLLGRTYNKKEILKEEVPEEFIDPDQARAYVKKHRIFASEGFDANKIDDEKILEFANALLEQMRLVGYKYKK